jgi:chromosome segregation ATPase
MFGPKKTKVSKTDLKKAVVSTNEKLRSSNARMEADIKAGEDELKLIESRYKEALKVLKDTQDLQGYARNELEGTQLEIVEVQTIVKKALEKVAKLTEESASLEESNKNLKVKEGKLSKTISLLESRKEELAILTCDLNQIRKESAVGQETLELLAVEINELESGVESYISRKSAAESEFKAFKGEIERSKRIAEEELKETENFGKTMKLVNGEEMGRLDHALAERMSELQDLEEMKRKKEYDLSTVQSKISIVENRVNNAEQRIEYAIKQEKEKVGKIKGDFKDWKIEALDEVARMKIKRKIENINKAGLKEVLDG